MRKIGLGLILVDESEKEIRFSLNEDCDLLRNGIKGSQDLFSIPYQLVAILSKNKYSSDELRLLAGMDSILKVIPFVKEHLRKDYVVLISPPAFLSILEKGDDDFIYGDLKMAISLLLREPAISSEIFYPDNYDKSIKYYTTVWYGKIMVVVTEKEIKKHSDNPEISSFLEKVRQGAISLSEGWDEDTFLRELKKLIGNNKK